ncbi:MAG: response regulator [Deltaproteobacteria bacterium]|jgi:signal transduction histidine kinase/CheY-like chemotaxis protein|nr:response regulator [Deltaproteobacteria bacterium]
MKVDVNKKACIGRNRIKCSISLFFATIFSAILLVFAVLSFKEVDQIKKVQALTEEIYTSTLPTLVENQKMLINVQNLRHLVQLAYYSDDLFIRRNSRLKARIIVGDPVFSSTEEMRKQGSLIIEGVDKLANVRNRISILKNALVNKSIQYLHLLEDVLLLVKTEDDTSEIFKIIKLYIKNDVTRNADVHEFGDRFQLILDHFTSLKRLMADAYKSSDSLQKKLLEGDRFIAVMSQQTHELIGLIDELVNIWNEVDKKAVELINLVRAGTENSIGTGLTSIMEGADSVLKSMYVFLSSVTLAVLIYFFGVYFFITKPLRWTSGKLKDIQSGKTVSYIPSIFIAEIATIADLLNRFSLQLTDLYQRASQLDEEKAKKNDLKEIMTAVFTSSMDGYLVWNNIQNVMEVNHRVLDLLSLPDSVDFTNNPEDFGLSNSYLGRSFEQAITKGYFREEVQLNSADQKPIPVEITHLPVHLHGGLGLLSYIRDLRTQKKHEEFLRRAKEAAEVATRTKSLFLANMSHEIRTPMNGLLGLVQLLLQTKLDASQTEYLCQLQNSAEVLLKIINDILDFSKIEANSLKIEEIDLDLEVILKTVLDFNYPRAEAKGIELVLEMAPSLATCFKGDPTRLSQVLNNLVSNGVKFTEKGQVTVRVKKIWAENQVSDRNVLCFEVIDTGIGLSQSQAASLFSPFTQADISTTRKYGGTGLGLAISKRLVEMMGGEIRLESEMGKGTNMSFTVPMRPSESVKHQAKNHFMSPEVLILAQSPVIINNLSYNLDNLGITSVGTDNLLDFSVLLRKETRQDAVLFVDWENAQEARLADLLTEVGGDTRWPVIVITDQSKSVKLGKILPGQRAVLRKPVFPSSLELALAKALRLRPAKTAQPQVPKVYEIPGLKDLRILLAEDNPVNQLVAVKFLEKAGLSVTVANNGQEALDLLDRAQFDLVLMDIQMPVMDGLEATRLIRARPEFLNLPIVAMTAHAMIGDMEVSLKAGMDAHVTKPINFEELFKTIIKLMDPDRKEIPLKSASGEK